MTVTDDEVRQLIRIADGRKGRWFTLGLTIPRSATIDDQLMAIRRLGLSGSPHALRYMASLAKVKTETQGPTDGPCGECSSREWRPYVKGRLSDVLRRFIPWDSSQPGQHSRYSEAAAAIEQALVHLEEPLEAERRSSNERGPV